MPTSSEAVVLVNPNVQVYNEDIQKQLFEQRKKLILLARMKLAQSGKDPVLPTQHLDIKQKKSGSAAQSG